MHKIVLMRHGQSTSDLANLVTGWTDEDLTDTGLAQAKNAGQLLKSEGFEFDVAYTSVLKRATRTLWHVLDEMDRTWLPVVNSWRLNEQHHGALQGLTKTDAANHQANATWLVWQGNYTTIPPALPATDPRSERHDVRYRKLKSEQIPLSESLQDTVARVMPFWQEALAPAIKLGKRVVVVAHENPVRALIKHLDNVSDEAIVDLHIPNGIPLVYELDENLKPIRHYHLGQASL